MVIGTGAVPGGAAAQAGFDRDVLAAINQARTQPRQLASELRRYRTTFDGKVARDGGDPIGIMSVEGVRAVDEAIDFLERQAPMPPLGEGPLLGRAARGWAATQGRIGGRGHGSAISASPGDRVRAAGGDIYVSETISYGMTSAIAVVRQLVVDDGQADRGHRDLIFSHGVRFAGVGCGEHARYGAMCVIDLAATADGSPPLPQMAANQPARARPFSR